MGWVRKTLRTGAASIPVAYTLLLSYLGGCSRPEPDPGSYRPIDLSELPNHKSEMVVVSGVPSGAGPVFRLSDSENTSIQAGVYFLSWDGGLESYKNAHFALDQAVESGNQTIKVYGRAGKHPSISSIRAELFEINEVLYTWD